MESKEWTLSERAAAPVPDRGIRFLRELKVIPRPRIQARFEKNGRLPAGEAEVDLLDCRRLKGQTGPPAYSLCTHVSSLRRGGEEDFLFEGLDPVLHALRWRAGVFRGFHLVDLGTGESKEETIPVAIHLARGAVTRRGRPASETRMTWRHLSTDIDSAAVSDEEGRYEVFLAPSGQYAVFLDGADFRRHAEIVEVEEDLEADFKVPGNRTEALVLDAESGRPIEGSWVAWHLEAAGAASLARAERADCDAAGKAQLPPFPEGRVVVAAGARGYRGSERQRLEITKDSTSTDLEFLLVKGDVTKVLLKDANGNPAARAWAQTPDGRRAAPADDTGETFFEAIVRPGDQVFAVSAAGAVVLVRFVDENTPILIGVPSRPFTVRFLTADGRPAPQVYPGYSIDGIPVPQPMDYIARRAAGGDVHSRADGTLVVAGLPGSGVVSLWPLGRPDTAVTRPLPVTETIDLPAP
jgi:hypothetical protein